MFTQDEADSFRRNGEAVIDMIERGDAWWAGWHDWVPDLAASIPGLPAGWEQL